VRAVAARSPSPRGAPVRPRRRIADRGARRRRQARRRRRAADDAKRRGLHVGEHSATLTTRGLRAASNLGKQRAATRRTFLKPVNGVAAAFPFAARRFPAVGDPLRPQESQICHILYDRHAKETLRQFDSYSGMLAGTAKSSIERRADAFAIHLLAPEGATRRLWHELEGAHATVNTCVRSLMSSFGISFTAARSHALNLHLLHPDLADRLAVASEIPPKFVASEEHPGVKEAAIPASRRGELFIQTMLALDDGVISRSLALEYLDVDAATFDAQRDHWAAVARDAE
jgi:hypothetical protein